MIGDLSRSLKGCAALNRGNVLRNAALPRGPALKVRLRVAETAAGWGDDDDRFTRLKYRLITTFEVFQVAVLAAHEVVAGLAGLATVQTKGPYLARTR
jgi:hypothetical protein